MKVLIAEDDPVSRHLLNVILSSSGYQVTIASDGAEALRVLKEPNSPRLVVLDWVMPKMDGVEICKAIRKQASEAYVYVILLTVKGEKREIIEGLEAGADDYVTKPFDTHELRARLRAGRRIIELQDQIIRSREELRFKASHDFLTALLNRSSIMEKLETEFIRAKREEMPLGLIMADIDHFKRVNDTYGHLAGDNTLREVAHRIRASIRPYDSVGRFGGEEFLIITPGCDLENTTKLAERLRQSVAMNVSGEFGDAIAVTMSFGVAAGTNFINSDQLSRAADEALYRAKIQGRNRVEASGFEPIPV